MEIYDYRDLSDAVNELSAVVDDLSPMECKRVLDFIDSMKKNQEVIEQPPISSTPVKGVRSILAAFAEKSGALLEIESQANGGLIASFFCDGIFSITREDMGIKSLICEASDLYIASVDGCASFSIAVQEKGTE